jgi:hypothetical protein
MVKIFLNGHSSERTFSVGELVTLGQLKIMLNNSLNRNGALKLILLEKNTQFGAKDDNTPLRNLTSFNSKTNVKLVLHALFKTDKYSKMRLPGIEEDCDTNAYKYLKTIHLLNRNAQMCAMDAQNNNSPFERQKINQLDEPISKKPKTSDFAKCTREISETLRTLSSSLDIMTRNLESTNMDVDSKSLRIIENNLDSCRYLAPLLKNYCALGVAGISKSINGNNDHIWTI